ncbi:YlxR family protein [Salana multivorans]
MRTCIGCRRRGERSDLVRLVALGPATVVVDERRSAPGRGGWLHPQHSCLELALRRGTVARALRLQPPVDTTAVASWMALNGVPAAGT